MSKYPDPDRSVDPRFPIPEEQPTRGPVDYCHGQPGTLENLGDPARRKHPTILSEEGEEEAPLSEIRDEEERA